MKLLPLPFMQAAAATGRVYNPQTESAHGMSKLGDALQKTSGNKPPLSRLVLTGFMGAGKSTVGALLARTLHWDFLDLDAVIEASSGLTVAQIFGQHGEANFRGRERQAVEQLSRQEQIVLALGGGTVEDEPSRSTLLHSPGTCLVFLEGNLADLIARCTAENKVRPLLAAPEMMAARHAYRLPFYRLAHLTVLTTGLTPQQVADRVIGDVAAQWRMDGKKVMMHGQS